jgi:hypothetical protein
MSEERALYSIILTLVSTNCLSIFIIRLLHRRINTLIQHINRSGIIRNSNPILVNADPLVTIVAEEV